MKSKQKSASYRMPSQESIVRSIVTSTAIETGQTSEQVEASLKESRKKYAHLRLAN
ncbi:hypothetical protein [Sodalis sp. dw_96]|uniref:hypothetical protein n=1 Tax=Sodalis sp. dw_96 TaxID=2719794 RepID=UPI002105E62F|nr:hypothetical protein [Sodalis sp. dw_96]